MQHTSFSSIQQNRVESNPKIISKKHIAKTQNFTEANSAPVSSFNTLYLHFYENIYSEHG